MDYEKKYKDALEKFEEHFTPTSDGIIADCISREQIENMFPELAESEDERIRKALMRFHKSTIDVDGIKGDDIIEWLEKQAPKPQGKTATEAIHEEKVDNANYISVNKSFSIGDWIVANECTRYRAKIYAFIGNGMVEFEDGTFETEENLLKDYHHWTIQDAKNGDVLVDVHGNISIYEKCDDFDWMSYCSLGNNGGFQHFKVEHENEDTYPATKEQRELLFEKMKEAGYVWDEEKKELRKIENQGEQKSKWSEDDEELLQHCCGAVAAADYYTLEDKEEMENWLKTIKQRWRNNND